jgi:hypothetical protein
MPQNQDKRPKEDKTRKLDESKRARGTKFYTREQKRAKQGETERRVSHRSKSSLPP